MSLQIGSTNLFPPQIQSEVENLQNYLSDLEGCLNAAKLETNSFSLEVRKTLLKNPEDVKIRDIIDKFTCFQSTILTLTQKMDNVIELRKNLYSFVSESDALLYQEKIQQTLEPQYKICDELMKNLLKKMG